MRSLLICAVILALMTTCYSESFSMSCTTLPNGEMSCKKVYSATGSESHSFAGSGRTFAEAGGRRAYNDYDVYK
ncbi:hypothetical protein HNY73_020407 [Argiope bruennichi]|uniref:Uncharacterized protein n=1 Tax=Argiope bruennichi TaxID=94029 RepID=A0A8T0E7G7_ARGBR|nr:hypothetical protein HNY73_020407 [Argiope bruennichi]